MGWSKQVLSEMISEVGWDEENGELLVTFIKKGRTAAYKGFSEDDAIRLSHAASVGSMFLSDIKPHASDWRYV